MHGPRQSSIRSTITAQQRRISANRGRVDTERALNREAPRPSVSRISRSTVALSGIRIKASARLISNAFLTGKLIFTQPRINATRRLLFRPD